MILSTLVTSQLHFEMCAGLYGHPVYSYLLVVLKDTKTGHVIDIQAILCAKSKGLHMMCCMVFSKH